MPESSRLLSALTLARVHACTRRCVCQCVRGRILVTPARNAGCCRAPMWRRKHRCDANYAKGSTAMFRRARTGIIPLPPSHPRRPRVTTRSSPPLPLVSHSRRRQPTAASDCSEISDNFAGCAGRPTACRGCWIFVAY